MKQRRLWQSSQKELTQKGDEHKERNDHQERSSNCSAESFLVGVGANWLTSNWTGGYSNCSAAVSTDRLFGNPVVRNCHVVSTRPVALNRPLRRPHQSASFWGPASCLSAQTVVVVPGRSSSVPDLPLGLVDRSAAALL